MKKFNSIIAIATVAISSVFGLSSCDKENDPINDIPEKTEEKQSIKAILTYEYSEDALEMFNVNYEITNFDGTVESFAVKQAGQQEKVLTTDDASKTAKVKTTIAVKTPYSPQAKDEYSFKFYSKVDAYLMEGTSDIEHTLSVNNDFVLSKVITFTYQAKDFSDEVIATLRDTYTYSLETVIQK